MANYTLSEATEFYQTAKAAYLNAMTNKSYDVAGRSKENQKIESLKKEMDYWAGIVNALKSGKTNAMQCKRIIAYV